MVIYRLSFAVLCGLLISCTAPLLTNCLFWIALPAVLVLFPGGLVAAIVFHSDLPSTIIALNSIIYSGLTYVALAFRRDLSLRFLRIASISMVLPAALVVGLASVPILDPLFPRGVTELGRQESSLQSDFPDRISIEKARQLMRSKGIQYDEFAPAAGLVLERENTMMVASSGDRLIHSRSPTTAREFLCSYDMEIDLLFDASGNLKQRYIHRFRICP